MRTRVPAVSDHHAELDAALGPGLVQPLVADGVRALDLDDAVGDELTE
jgi:hypothetical protein